MQFQLQKDEKPTKLINDGGSVKSERGQKPVPRRDIGEPSGDLEMFPIWLPVGSA